ncbi:MAG: T9SS type A sorting domain-containing protein [Bacteroidetes bacterium]|nr:MAG: T9SS type A sorting domain-containing protein [Bacteroidota bacterium]
MERIMKHRYNLIIELILIIVFFSSNLSAQSFKIVVSSNSLEPPGIHGTNSLNSGGFAFAYNSYWLKNVYYASYPVYSRNSDVFARFETNPQGTKLIVRKASNGDSINGFDITGFNPQWIGSSGKLYYEKPPSNGVSECRSIDVSTGADTKIGELRDQYYPASDPGLGAGALSPDGTKIAYLKGAAIFIYSISTGEEKPLVKPMEDNTVDDSLVRKVYLVAGPSYPNTIRHLSWSKNGDMIACYGQVNYKITFPPDTTLYPRSREGILVVNTSSGEVRTIYETQNYSFEHPENFFFSPTGRTLAFNVSGLNNKVHIFMANPKKSNSGRDRGIGSIIAGFPSKQYWALNPWSSDGSKLLYQNDEDGTLGYTRECSDGQIIMNKDVKKIYIQDVQWADVIASNKPYTITLVDINNNPIAEKLFYLYLNGCKIDSITTDAAGKFSLSAYAGDTLKVEHYPFSRKAVKPGHDSCAGDTMYNVVLDNGKFDGVGNRSYFELGADLNPTLIVDHTTIKFNLIISLEWDAKREYIDSLANWLKELSNYYYDVTDGQLFFNQIDIYDNKQKWDECDICVLANNNFVPYTMYFLQKGGIFSTDEDIHVNMPRKWFGSTNNTRYFTSQNDWLIKSNDDFWTTIGHELGHYLFGFSDEYKYLNGAGRAIAEPAILFNYNFGFMDTQYPGFGDWSSEMSNSTRYPNDSYKITEQWYYNIKDCWTDFETEYEKTNNGVLCPIIKPTERTLNPGSTFLPGPIMNVGKELITNIYDKNTGAGDYNIRVKDAAGNDLIRTWIDLYKPKSIIQQGMNTSDGSFKVIGANIDDVLNMVTIDRDSNVIYTQIEKVKSVSGVDKKKEQTLVDDANEIIMRKVNGYFNQVNIWEFDENANLNFKSYVNKEFSQSPRLELPTGLDFTDFRDLTFDNNQLIYSCTFDTTLNKRGLLSINAYDDSQDSFFVPISYSITGFSSFITGPDGDVNLYLDQTNDTISKFAILSCGFLTSRNGLDLDAEQSGNVHSITTYPFPISTEKPSMLQIGYSPEELKRKPQDWLRIFKWNEDSLKWNLLGGVVDSVNYYVRTSITSTGAFAVFTVNNPVNVDDGSFNYNIQISPNPCDDIATLTYSNLKEETVSISLFNSFGNELALLSEKTNLSQGNHKLEINTSNLLSGMYFMRISTGGNYQVVKFVVLR